VNEKTTRQLLIDKKLLDAKWDVNDLSQVVQEYSFTASSGTQEPIVFYDKTMICDYILLGPLGYPIAVIEAKKSSKDAEVGKEQAKQYCYNIQKEKGGELPFCFYTNGHDIFFWDLDNYPPRKVIGFPRKDDFARMSYIRKARKSLSGELINTSIVGRGYQLSAIKSVLEAIEMKRTKMLLVMATGTGKTRTVIALVDALMRGGWMEKALFLVDRIALRDQALDAFKEFLPNEPRWPQGEESELALDRRIYVSTYPTMLNIIREQKLSPHFFDVIVIDESHRSIYNTYQEILNYFNAITIGLTATPTDIIDHNTFQIFECQDGLPTFAYTFAEALNHIPPYLCDFQILKIKTLFQEQGINKRTLTLQDQKKLMLEGKEVADINIAGQELERTVMNKGTNALIVRSFMEDCIKDDNGVLPGKTIFFCMNISHARRMEKIFEDLYPEYNGNLARVLVSEDPGVYGKGGLLDQFTNQDMPRIAISVDMLDTGIDVRELVNLVFAKPVFSYTKFWQMIGRGTRRLDPDKLKAWCKEKNVFLIMDCWDNFDFFKLNPQGVSLPPQIPLPIRLVGMRIHKIRIARGLNEINIAIHEEEKLRSLIAQLPKNSISILEAQEYLEEINPIEFWNGMNEERLSYIEQYIKPLFKTLVGVDFLAMRFEKDILEVSIAKLNGDKSKFDTLKEGIIAEISELPLSINTVAKEKDLILKAMTQNYWATINESGFDELIDRLAPLMKYINRGGGSNPVNVNYQDAIHSKEWIEFGPSHEGMTILKYKEMVEERIQSLVNENILLQKIQKGEALSELEINDLSDFLMNERPNITLENLQRIYENRKAKLQDFIKHILGLEVLQSYAETVTAAIDQYIREHTYLNSQQIEFMQILKSFLIEKGHIERRDFISSPFIKVNHEGIRGIFSSAEIEEIIKLAEELSAA
jgi:type I restriction enzyme, R subunit